MSKKSAKLALTYFLTILFALVLIGGAGYFLLKYYFTGGEKESGIKPAAPAEQTTVIDMKNFVPDDSHCQTILFIYEPEKRMTAVCFVLARFVPTENKAVVVPLQSDICTTLDGQANTLYEFYRLNGTSGAKRAVEEATGVGIDRYMKFTKESFTIFSDLMGNINFDVPYNLVYDNEETGESTIVKSGEQILDSTLLRKVLTYPNYKGGEEYRAKVVGTIAVSLVNSGSKTILRDSFDTVFTDIINSDVETDITRYDYDEKKPAVDYVLANTDSPAQLVIPSGIYNENNCYVLDDNFIQALPRWFCLE